MKSILLHVDGDQCFEARKQVALDLARAGNGHITCLQAVSYEVFAPGDFYGNAMAAAMPRIKEAAEELRAKVEADLSNEGASFEWRFCYGMAETHLLEQSALHDVIVIGPHDIGEDGSRGPSAMAGELAIKAPAPVLVVPGEVKSFDPSDPVMVAWNGSSEACIAMRRALPLLAQSKNVFLASVAEPGERTRYEFPVREAAMYLDRHDVSTEVVEIPKGKESVADALSRAAQVRNCSSLVIGAYGHSRLAELLMGGVIRSVLTDPALPVLMAH